MSQLFASVMYQIPSGPAGDKQLQRPGEEIRRAHFCREQPESDNHATGETVQNTTGTS